MSSLQDRLDEEYAESWRPSPGDTLIGEVVGLSSNDAGWGSYPIVTVKPEGSGPAAAFHAFHTVARLRLSEIRPKIGQHIAIRYLGTQAPKDGQGKPYHNYRIVSDSEEGTLDWDAIGGHAASIATPAERKAAEPEPFPEDDVPF